MLELLWTSRLWVWWKDGWRKAWNKGITTSALNSNFENVRPFRAMHTIHKGTRSCFRKKVRYPSASYKFAKGFTLYLIFWHQQICVCVSLLPLSLLMSYIYRAPNKARNLTSYIYMDEIFTGHFASWTVHFVNICVKNQQIHQLFIQFLNYVW
jgi:hypothetical protein